MNTKPFPESEPQRSTASKEKRPNPLLATFDTGTSYLGDLKKLKDPSRYEKARFSLPIQGLQTLGWFLLIFGQLVLLLT